MSLYDRIISFLDSTEKYDEQTVRLLLYYIVLVELGYADLKVIGATSVKEYSSLSIEDLYMHLLLTKNVVRSHIQAVLQEAQL
jgi:hypothetical protein